MDENQCLFCKISKGEIPSQKVYEDDSTFAFLDINPRNPGHTLVIPKKHVETILDADDATLSAVIRTVRKIAVAAKNAAKADGVSIVQSNGRAAGQVVAHMHFHVIPRFNAEGPPSLEGILQIKKFDEQSMNKLAESIKSNISSSSPEQHESEAPAEEGEEKKDEISFDF